MLFSVYDSSLFKSVVKARHDEILDLVSPILNDTNFSLWCSDFYGFDSVTLLKRLTELIDCDTLKNPYLLDFLLLAYNRTEINIDLGQRVCNCTSSYLYFRYREVWDSIISENPYALAIPRSEWFYDLGYDSVCDYFTADDFFFCFDFMESLCKWLRQYLRTTLAWLKSLRGQSDYVDYFYGDTLVCPIDNKLVVNLFKHGGYVKNGLR